MQTEIKDHGVREEMITGSKRDTQKGKSRFDLMPAFIKMLLGFHYSGGSDKYGDRNWEKGQPVTRYIASMERHWLAWQCGLIDEPHLIAAIWNLISIKFTLFMIKVGYLPAELDDRPIHMQEGNAIGKELHEEQERRIKNALTAESNYELQQTLERYKHHEGYMNKQRNRS